MSEKRGTVYIAPSAYEIPRGRMVDPRTSVFFATWQDWDEQNEGHVVEHCEQIIGGEAAIIWGRERADVVLIRLGHSRDTYFSAGEHPAHKESMPLWPPRKPPPEGWYHPRPNEPSHSELTDGVHAHDNIGSVAPMIWAQGIHLPEDV